MEPGFFVAARDIIGNNGPFDDQVTVETTIAEAVKWRWGVERLSPALAGKMNKWQHREITRAYRAYMQRLVPEWLRGDNA